MGTWRVSSEADTRQDCRKSAKLVDALMTFILKVQETVRKGVGEKGGVYCLAVEKCSECKWNRWNWGERQRK